MEEVLLVPDIHEPRRRPRKKTHISAEAARRRYIQDAVWTELSLRRSKNSSGSPRSARTARSVLSTGRRSFPQQYSSPRALKRANTTLTEKISPLKSKGINPTLSDHIESNDHNKTALNTTGDHSGVKCGKSKSAAGKIGSNINEKIDCDNNKNTESITRTEKSVSGKDIPTLKCDILKEIIKSESIPSESSFIEQLNTEYRKSTHSSTSAANSASSSTLDVSSVKKSHTLDFPSRDDHHSQDSRQSSAHSLHADRRGNSGHHNHVKHQEKRHHDNHEHKHHDKKHNDHTEHHHDASHNHKDLLSPARSPYRPSSPHSFESSADHQRDAPLKNTIKKMLGGIRMGRYMRFAGNTSRYHHDPSQYWTRWPDLQPLEKFKKAAHMITLLLRACRDNSRDQRRNESRFMSFTQYQDEISNQTNRVFYGTELTFDPKQFKAHTEVQLSPEAKAILELDPRDRTEEQRHIALVGLQQTVSAFSEFPITMQRALVRVGWYEQFESKRVIIRQGHTADNFYMIISGTAVVTKLETDVRSGESFAHTVAMLGKGNSFGELALMHGATRSATVTSKDTMELLALGRDDFIDIFMHIEKDKEPEHIRYLRALDIIKGWPIDKLPWDNPKICLFTYFRRGVVMCRDNNTSDWIYVIKTGSCRVLKTLTAVKPNIPGLHKHTYSEDVEVPVTNQKSVMPSMRNSMGINNDTASISTTDSRMAMRLSLMVMDTNKQRFTVAKTGTLLALTRSPAAILPPIQSELNGGFREEDEYEEEDAASDANIHISALDKIFKEKHPDDGTSSRFTRAHDKDDKMHTMYVQIQRLGPKDTFGLDAIAFSLMGKCPKVSMVSEGSEAILINKKFFMAHLSDDVQKRIRVSLQPYPSDESLQQRFQDQVNWDAFKTLCVKDHVVYNKYMNDTLNY